jgi:hypothetical protein
MAKAVPKKMVAKNKVPVAKAAKAKVAPEETPAQRKKRLAEEKAMAKAKVRK